MEKGNRKFVYVNKYFEIKKNRNNLPIIKLNKTTYMKKRAILVNRINSIFKTNDYNFSINWLGKISQYAKSTFIEKSQKFSNNVCTGIHQFFLIDVIVSNLNRIKDDRLRQKFEIFLKKFNQLASFSLIKFDFEISKIIVESLLGDSKYDIDSMRFLLNEIRVKTLSPVYVIKILKEMLNNLQESISKNEQIILFINPDIIETWASNSLIDNLKFLRLNKKESEKQKIILDIVKNISDFISVYNDLIEALFSSNLNDRFICFKWLYSILYSNRGIYSNIKLNSEVYQDVAKSISAEDLQDLNLKEIEAAIPDLSEIVKDLLKGVKITKNKENDIFQNDNLYITSAAGPNGSPSLLTMPLDAKALRKNSKLRNSIVKLGELFGITNIEQSINTMAASDYPEIKDNMAGIEISNPVDSKLFIFSEPGDKWRIVAEIDSFSQTVLNPIHNLLSSISKNLNFISAHYDQDTAVEELFKQSQKTGFIGTFDLKNATDMLYVSLLATCIDEIVKQAYNIENTGSLWMNVISKDREFVVNRFENEKPLKYKIGQPMGAKSSWIAMHITLIILAKQAEINAKRINPNFENVDHFSICGDDCEFTDHEVYNCFKEIITKLRLQINESKSYSSYHPNNKELLFGEYLKKLIFQDQLIVPFSARMGGKFFNQPKQQIFSYLKQMFFLDLNFNAIDLLAYTFQKDYLYFINDNDDLLSEGNELDTLVNMCEQIHYWFLLNDDMGGLNLDLDTFNNCFKDKEIFGIIQELNCNVNPSRNVKCKILESQIRLNHFRCTKRINSAILTIFTKEGLEVINSSLQKIRLSGSFDVNDIEALSEFFKNDFSQDIIKTYPIFKILIEITLQQKLDLEKAIAEQIEILDKTSKDPAVLSYTEGELNLLKELLKLSKKKLQIIDMYYISVPELNEDLSETNPISKQRLNIYKRIGSIENNIINQRALIGKADSLFK